MLFRVSFVLGESWKMHRQAYDQGHGLKYLYIIPQYRPHHRRSLKPPDGMWAYVRFFDRRLLPDLEVAPCCNAPGRIPTVPDCVLSPHTRYLSYLGSVLERTDMHFNVILTLGHDSRLTTHYSHCSYACGHASLSPESPRPRTRHPALAYLPSFALSQNCRLGSPGYSAISIASATLLKVYMVPLLCRSYSLMGRPRRVVDNRIDFGVRK